MFTLSQASYDTKQGLKWLGIGILGIVVLFFLIKGFFIVKDIIFPKPPPKAAAAFGKLQPVVFPKNVTDKNLTYTVNTNSGKLPVFNNQIKVYVLDPNEPDLLALNKMQTKFYHGGFKGSATPISKKLFRWNSDPDLPGIPRTIEGDIVNSSFIIQSNFITEGSILSAADLPNQAESIDLAIRYLKNMNYFTDDLDLAKVQTKLFAIQNGKLTPSTSISNSNIVEVDLYQKDVNKLPIFYEDATSSNIKFLVAGGVANGQVVSANYSHQGVNKTSSTYPIITTDKAYEELKGGRGYISTYFGAGSEISITDVFLAYYIGSSTQDFLTPIYVFQGNDGFFAYIPAVTDEWTNK